MPVYADISMLGYPIPIKFRGRRFGTAQPDHRAGGISTKSGLSTLHKIPLWTISSKALGLSNARAIWGFWLAFCLPYRSYGHQRQESSAPAAFQALIQQLLDQWLN